MRIDRTSRDPSIHSCVPWAFAGTRKSATATNKLFPNAILLVHALTQTRFSMLGDVIRLSSLSLQKHSHTHTPSMQAARVRYRINFDYCARESGLEVERVSHSLCVTIFSQIRDWIEVATQGIGFDLCSHSNQHSTTADVTRIYLSSIEFMVSFVCTLLRLLSPLRTRVCAIRSKFQATWRFIAMTSLRKLWDLQFIFGSPAVCHFRNVIATVWINYNNLNFCCARFLRGNRCRCVEMASCQECIESNVNKRHNIAQ